MGGGERLQATGYGLRAERAGGLRLYAIIKGRPREGLGKLEIVRAGGASVVVGRGGVVEATAAAVKAHDRVVRRIQREVDAVLPFRFGSVVADAAALRRMLEPVTAAVRTALELVDGCMQYTLRVYGDAAAVETPKTGAGPGTQWLGVRLRARRVPEIAAITEATADYVRAAKAERHDRPPLVASVYHLVPNTEARAYRAAVTRASKTLGRVTVKTSGPFAPYAFAELV